MRAVTTKSVQIHFSCVCGRNVVDHQDVKLRWRDLSKAGITNKIDKSTGKWFLLMKQTSEVCTCYSSD